MWHHLNVHLRMMTVDVNVYYINSEVVGVTLRQILRQIK